MNKLFGIFFSGLLLIIGTIFYAASDYHIKDFFCKSINLCNHSRDNQSTNLSYSGEEDKEIIHSISEKIYPEIRFHSDNTGDQILLQQIDQGYNTCKRKSYGMGSFFDGCENITGYQHNYIINKFGILLSAYTHSDPTTFNNPGIFDKSILLPFSLSGNRVYDIQGTGDFSHYSYIEYRDLSGGITEDSILQEAQTKNYNGFTYDRQTQIQTTEAWNTYEIIYQKGNEYPFSIWYYFQDGKSYYYIAEYGGECIPESCGLRQHDIQLFTK